MPKVLPADAPYFGLDDDGYMHPKRVDEDWKLLFDFNKRLPSSVTISSATWTATVHAGTDASPNDIISGSASNASGKSTQKVINGTDGVTYIIVCAATLSDTQVLHGVGLLRVSNAVR